MCIELQDILLHLFNLLHQVVRLDFSWLQHHGFVVKENGVGCLALLHGLNDSLQSIEFVVDLAVDLFKVLHVVLLLYPQVLFDQNVLIVRELLELRFHFDLFGFAKRFLLVDLYLFVKVFKLLLQVFILH